MIIISSLVVLVILIAFVFDGFIIVKEKSAVALERLGKFQSVKKSGFHLKLPIFDRVRKRVSLKLQQLNVEVDTKTKDNVFIKAKVSVQLKVLGEKVREAVYELEDPTGQAETYIFDVVRAEVPKMSLDEVYESKDTIAKAINTSLKEKMNEYGFDVESTQVTDVDPDQNVKDAMNQIQTTERLKVAATNEAEAEKIKVVKKAEAEAEAKKLVGKGYADLRKEISVGAKESVESLVESGLTAQEATNFMLKTQQFETISSVGSHGNSVLMMPNGGGNSDMLTDLITATKVGDKKES